MEHDAPPASEPDMSTDGGASPAGAGMTATPAVPLEGTLPGATMEGEPKDKEDERDVQEDRTLVPHQEVVSDADEEVELQTRKRKRKPVPKAAGALQLTPSQVMVLLKADCLTVLAALSDKKKEVPQTPDLLSKETQVAEYPKTTDDQEEWNKTILIVPLTVHESFVHEHPGYDDKTRTASFSVRPEVAHSAYVALIECIAADNRKAKTVMKFTLPLAGKVSAKAEVFGGWKVPCPVLP
jgi:hypothetical protein